MSNVKKKRWGDRKEGRLVRGVEPLNKFEPFIMIERNDSTNYYEGSFGIEKTEKYIRRKREDGLKGFGMMHVFIASYIRTVSQHPALNRFVSGQRIYKRNNIQVVLTVKRQMRADAPETTIKVEFEPTDTALDVYRKMSDSINFIKHGEEDNNTEKVAAALMKIPRVILKFAVRVIKIMDYFDLLPASLLAASPFHGSMIITNLGSLGIQPIYHHLYNFGNLPVFVAFGSKRRCAELQDDGTVAVKRYVDFKCTLDERICDGYYYARAFKTMKHLMSNPAELDNPPETVLEDID